MTNRLEKTKVIYDEANKKFILLCTLQAKVAQSAREIHFAVQHDFAKNIDDPMVDFDFDIYEMIFNAFEDEINKAQNICIHTKQRYSKQFSIVRANSKEYFRNRKMKKDNES